MVKTVLRHANIPEDSVETNGEDPSGMGSALRCNRQGHRASMRTMAKLLNFTLSMTPEDEIKTFLSPSQNIGGLIAANTNPFLGYRETITVGKTGTVTGLSTGVFRVQHLNTDITFALSCKDSKSRYMIGRSIIDRFTFNAQPISSTALDIQFHPGNSQQDPLPPSALTLD